MYIKRITILTLALGLAGCANSESSTAQAKAEDDGMVCKMEKPTGSNIATRVCRTPEELERERELARDSMQSMTRGGVRQDN